jgi:hypothetical protein
MCYFCSLTWWYKLAVTNSLIQYPDQLFIKYIVSPLVILSISHGDWGDNCCLGSVGYLGIERAGAGGRSKNGGMGLGGSDVRHGDSRVQVS